MGLGEQLLRTAFPKLGEWADKQDADKPLVWFELFSEDTARPDLGGLALTHWSFQIPGFHGDGTYDLTAIAGQREAAGAAPEYLEWARPDRDGDDRGLAVRSSCAV